MYAVSPEFAAAVVSGHQGVIVRAEAWLGDQMLCELPIIAGTVTADGRRAQLRSCSLTVTAGDTTLLESWAALSTIGVEVRVWRGLRLGARDELVPLGVFVLDEAPRDGDDETMRSIAVEMTDRSVRISRAKREDPYVVAADTNIATALSAFLLDRWEDCPIGFIAAEFTQTVGAQAVFEAGESSDPWVEARSLAKDVGLDLYFDAAGVARLRALNDPETAAPVWTYDDSDESVVLSVSERVSSTDTYSGVIVSGEGSSVDTPVRASAWDTDPLSPTYYLGAFGRKPRFYSSSLLTTEEMCQTAADGMLPKYKGKTTQMGWTQVTNPALEPFDVVLLRKTPRTYMFDVVSIPLTVEETMATTARETREAT